MGQRIIGQKSCPRFFVNNFLVKYFFSLKKIWSKKFGEKNLVKKIVGQKILVKKIFLVKKNFWSKNSSGQKRFVGQIIF